MQNHGGHACRSSRSLQRSCFDIHKQAHCYLELHGINANAVKPKGDKRTRLSLTSMSIKSGVIKFPRQGCEDLIQQLVGFGVEKHDDLADAFSLLINSTLDKIMDESTWIMASMDGDTLFYHDYIDVETGK